MATYNSFKITEVLAVNANDNTTLMSSNMIGTVYSFGGFEAVLEPPTLFGADFTRGQTLGTSNNYTNGIITACHEKDWFEKIYITLKSIDLGNVRAQIEFDMYVFSNYWHDAKLCQSIANKNPSDVLLTQGVQAPYLFRPHEMITYKIVVPEEGNLGIDSSYTWVFVDAPSVKIEITGRRITKLSLPYLLDAEWADGMEVTRRYSTSVHTGMNMDESRVALRGTPIREIQARLFFNTAKSAMQAWASIKNSARGLFAMPYIPDVSYTTGIVTDTVPTIPCDTRIRRFFVDSQALIASFDENGAIIHQELVLILAKTDSSITISWPTLHIYPVGSAVFPVMPCTPALQGSSIETMTDNTGLLTLKAEESYSEYMIPRENTAYTPQTKYGHPIFPLSISWANAINIEASMGGDTYASGRGTGYYVLGNNPAMSYSVDISLLSRQESWNACGFFNYINGMGRVFWFRGMLDMFEVVKCDGAIGQPLLIEAQKCLIYEDYVSIKALLIENAAGTTDIVKVTLIEELVNGNLRFITDLSTINNVVRMRDALLVRMSADDITESYVTSEVSTMSFTVQEVINAYG